MANDDSRGEAMAWQHLLASMTGTVDQARLLRHEYLMPEHRILRHQRQGHSRLSDGAQGPRRERPEAGPAGPHGSGSDRQGRDDARLAPHPGRTEVWRLPAAAVSRASHNRPGAG